MSLKPENLPVFMHREILRAIEEVLFVVIGHIDGKKNSSDGKLTEKEKSLIRISTRYKLR